MMINIDRSKIPFEAHEGDILIVDNDIITIDIKETSKRRAEIEKLMENLWE